jgi:sugar/nucleoside kinase (ribokinase family)
MKVVAVGECTIDRYVDLGVCRPGGISLNFAVQARRAGADDVAIVSCISPDAGGATVRGALVEAGVDVSRLHLRPGRTASQIIHIASDGERHFPPGGYDAGVLADFSLDPDDLTAVQAADVVAVPCFRQLRHLVRQVQDIECRGLLAADLLDGADLGDLLAAIDALLDRFDVLFVSGDQRLVAQLGPHAARSRTVIVVTHGADGSTALAGRAVHRAAAEPVAPRDIVDTTGCGDAFQAAFTVSYARDRDIPTALHAGARRAALTLRHLGGIPIRHDP